MIYEELHHIHPKQGLKSVSRDGVWGEPVRDDDDQLLLMDPVKTQMLVPPPAVVKTWEEFLILMFLVKMLCFTVMLDSYDYGISAVVAKLLVWNFLKVIKYADLSTGFCLPEGINDEQQLGNCKTDFVELNGDQSSV